MIHTLRILLAWSVHLFTACGALCGVLALSAINTHQYVLALCYMGIALLIDMVDGLLARLFKVNLFAYSVDGDLLDNIISFFTYSMIPAVFILSASLVAEPYRLLSAILICFASCYQFTQYDAKTDDHSFKRFPSYWNILVFYAYCFNLPYNLTLALIILCFVASFVPIKYVHPFFMEHISKNRHYQWLMLLATTLWVLLAGITLAIYPSHNFLITCYLIAYVLIYFLLSIYRTYYPLQPGGYK